MGRGVIMNMGRSDLVEGVGSNGDVKMARSGPPWCTCPFGVVGN